jgi:hypothetical protein
MGRGEIFFSRRATKRRGLGFGLCVMAAWAAVVASPGPVDAFGTTRYVPGIKGNAEHERITRWAFRRYGMGSDTLTQLAGRTLTFGAVGTPDLYSITDSIAHCDDGDHAAVQSEDKAKAQLDACRQRMFAELKTAVQAAGRLVDKDGTLVVPLLPVAGPVSGCDFDPTKSERAKCEVLAALGRALHASQDFYSHSTWGDTESTRDAEAIDPLKNPKGMKHLDTAPFIDPAKPGNYQSDLQTGCYVLLSSACDGRLHHETLNKDNGDIDPVTLTIGAGQTPRGGLRFEVKEGGYTVETGAFENAVLLAVVDTRKKWGYFQQQILASYPELVTENRTAARKTRGDLIMCVLLNDSPRDCGKTRRTVAVG